MTKRCSWCNTDPADAAARHEGPHATWCLHFRTEQRGGRKGTDGTKPTIMIVDGIPTVADIPTKSDEPH